MGMGFAPTWLCQVSPLPCFIKHFNHWLEVGLVGKFVGWNKWTDIHLRCLHFWENISSDHFHVGSQFCATERLRLVDCSWPGRESPVGNHLNDREREREREQNAGEADSEETGVCVLDDYLRWRLKRAARHGHVRTADSSDCGRKSA